jgi:hypothetical protein
LATIDALAGRGGEDEVGARRRFGLPVEGIAPRKPAGGVHQHRLKALVVGIWQADLGGAFLIERRDVGGAIAHGGRDASGAAGPLHARRVGHFERGD